MPTYQLIQTVSPSGTATASFTSIPATYDDLLVVWSGRTARSTGNKWDECLVSYNSDTTNTNYHTGYMAAAGATGSYAMSAGGGSNNTRYIGSNSPSTVTADVFSANWFYINKYTTTTPKNAVGFGVAGDTTGGEAIQAFLKWNSSAAITRIDLATTSGTNYVSGTNFYLYGIKNT